MRSIWALFKRRAVQSLRANSQTHARTTPRGGLAGPGLWMNAPMVCVSWCGGGGCLFPWTRRLEATREAWRKLVLRQTIDVKADRCRATSMKGRATGTTQSSCCRHILLGKVAHALPLSLLYVRCMHVCVVFMCVLCVVGETTNTVLHGQAAPCNYVLLANVAPQTTRCRQSPLVALWQE